MSKVVNVVELCGPCASCHWISTENKHYCFHPSRTIVIEIKDISKLLPDCPLLDWPSISRDEIRELLTLKDEPLGAGIDRAIEKLRSIGVIVREGEKDAADKD